MRYVILLALFATIGCTDSPEQEERSRKELIQLAECVCSGKGGIAYLKMYPQSYAAYATCVTTDTEFHLHLGDYCRKQ